MKKYYKKGDPRILLTEEILEKVPKLHEQQFIDGADKVVHAAYIMPFRDLTWYMTEYDRKSGYAFGLIVGIKCQWGYFNIHELEKSHAQRLILEDFPKTFRELKDTELVKQMSSNELETIFGGKLKFSKDEQELPWIEKLEILRDLKIIYKERFLDKDKEKDDLDDFFHSVRNEVKKLIKDDCSEIYDLDVEQIDLIIKNLKKEIDPTSPFNLYNLYKEKEAKKQEKKEKNINHGQKAR